MVFFGQVFSCLRKESERFWRFCCLVLGKINTLKQSKTKKLSIVIKCQIFLDCNVSKFTCKDLWARCMKYARIHVFSGLYFPELGLNWRYCPYTGKNVPEKTRILAILHCGRYSWICEINTTYHSQNTVFCLFSIIFYLDLNTA